MIGEKVHVLIVRPLGSVHPKHKTIVHEVNYGYVPNTVGGDGVVIAVILRNDDNETKWIVAPENKAFSDEEIIQKTGFQEKYFDIKVLRS